MEEEPKKYFTPDEVEALIPELARLMGPLMDAHGKLLEIRSGLREEQHRLVLAGGGILDREGWRERTRRLEGLTREVQEKLEAIVRLGGVPKDLTMGLVDFPGLRGDEEVNLCWRFGERTIRFWHGLDEGFAGRKPL